MIRAGGALMSADLSAAHTEPGAATGAEVRTPSWVQTAITVVLTMAAILLVSFISVVTHL
jgi:hypothetical protein